MNSRTVNVFYSYSHRDEKFREALETHLSILRRENIVKEWHDRKISPGSEWEKEIDDKLDESDLIILLVSPDFIASDYCWGKEVKQAMERHEAQLSLVIPIIVRPTDWTGAPFSKLQALPKDAKPITNWPTEDDGWLDVVRSIRSAVNEIQRANENRKSKTSQLIAIDALLTEEVERVDIRYSSQSKIGGYRTGFSILDDAVDGLHVGDLWVIAASPEVDKLEFALRIVQSVSTIEKKGTAVFSMRFPALAITRQLFSILANINPHEILRGSFGVDKWPSLVDAVGQLNDAPLLIDDTIDRTISEITDQVSARKATDSNLSLIVIDSLQNLAINNTANSPATARRLVQSLRSLARSQNVAVIVTSQLPERLGLRDDELSAPEIADLGEWRFLQEEAEVVLLMHESNVTDVEINDQVWQVELAKNDRGPLRSLRLSRDVNLAKKANRKKPKNGKEK